MSIMQALQGAPSKDTNMANDSAPSRWPGRFDEMRGKRLARPRRPFADPDVFAWLSKPHYTTLRSCVWFTPLCPAGHLPLKAGQSHMRNKHGICEHLFLQRFRFVRPSIPRNRSYAIALPLKGGDRQDQGPACIAEKGRHHTYSLKNGALSVLQSPPLRGRCPARQRGVGHPTYLSTVYRVSKPRRLSSTLFSRLPALKTGSHFSVRCLKSFRAHRMDPKTGSHFSVRCLKSFRTHRMDPKTGSHFSVRCCVGAAA